MKQARSLQPYRSSESAYAQMERMNASTREKNQDINGAVLSAGCRTPR